MARKKKEDSGGGGSPAWMATFSDLMNLLLCFFVLLFAMSSVDEEAFADIAASFNNSFSIFSGGAQAIGEGKLVSQGASQLNNLSQYFNQMGAAGEDDSMEEGTGSVSEYKEQLAEEQKKATEMIYEEIVEAAEKKNIEDAVEVAVDEGYQYVRIVMNGAILFDSGSDRIKEGAIPILSKIGDILKTYDKHLIKIEGHTDNIPIKSNRFPNNVWLSTARATEVFAYLTEKKKLDPESMEASGRGEYNPIADNKTESGRAKNRRVEIKIYSKE
ncbi:MAG: flagellar motor protein MotB [Acetivibrio ethanolgignens]